MWSPPLILIAAGAAIGGLIYGINGVTGVFITAACIMFSAALIIAFRSESLHHRQKRKAGHFTDTLTTPGTSPPLASGAATEAVIDTTQSQRAFM